jgi:hypothetical protein
VIKSVLERSAAGHQRPRNGKLVWTIWCLTVTNALQIDIDPDRLYIIEFFFFFFFFFFCGRVYEKDFPTKIEDLESV